MRKFFLVTNNRIIYADDEKIDFKIKIKLVENCYYEKPYLYI